MFCRARICLVTQSRSLEAMLSRCIEDWQWGADLNEFEGGWWSVMDSDALTKRRTQERKREKK